MKKLYSTLLLLLITASVFSSQLYKKENTSKGKPLHCKSNADNIISDMAALPAFKQ